MRFSVEIASSLAELPTQGICREYPNKLDHVINGPTDLRSPKALHPAFYGCFDWHSAVHSHWMLIHVLRRFDLPNAAKIRRLLAANLTAENIRAEVDYLAEPNRQSFERPYGWAWLLHLAQELRGWDDDQAREWSQNLMPLEAAIRARFVEFLPRQQYPVRTGTHSNTAFSLSMAFDYALTVGDEELSSLVTDRALDYFGSDVGYQPFQEPSGANFFSPTLIEADLLRRLMTPAEFEAWLTGFLPDLFGGAECNLLHPVSVSDRKDPQLGHLDGLNLSRAWCLSGISKALVGNPEVHKRLADAAYQHAVKGLSHVITGDYVGEHWLATFAVYVLSSFES